MLDPKGSSADRPPSRRTPQSENTLVPGIPLAQIGQALASFYDDLIAEGVPEALAALVRKVDPPKPASVAKSGKLALVVEDDAATRALAEALLEETELAVVGCDSAEAALSVMRERGGDVVLVFADIQLAGVMDGVQLASAVALLWPTARMVVTSGCRSGRPDLLPSHAVFIPKPWRPFDVLVEAERAKGDARPMRL